MPAHLASTEEMTRQKDLAKHAVPARRWPGNAAQGRLGGFDLGGLMLLAAALVGGVCYSTLPLLGFHAIGQSQHVRAAALYDAAAPVYEQGLLLAPGVAFVGMVLGGLLALRPARHRRGPGAPGALSVYASVSLLASWAGWAGFAWNRHREASAATVSLGPAADCNLILGALLLLGGLTRCAKDARGHRPHWPGILAAGMAAAWLVLMPLWPLAVWRVSPEAPVLIDAFTLANMAGNQGRWSAPAAFLGLEACLLLAMAVSAWPTREQRRVGLARFRSPGVLAGIAGVCIASAWRLHQQIPHLDANVEVANNPIPFVAAASLAALAAVDVAWSRRQPQIGRA